MATTTTTIAAAAAATTTTTTFRKIATTLVGLILLVQGIQNNRVLGVVVVGVAEETSSTTASDGSHGQQGTTTWLSSSYGVDVSWPMHYHPIIDGKEDAMESTTYGNYMKGCYQQYNNNHELCEEYERDRIEMNFEQPRVMINYTHAGFAKVSVPIALRTMLTQFWNDHHYDIEDPSSSSSSHVQMESWPRGNTYTNHWSSPTNIMNIANQPQTRNMIIEHVGSILEAWTGGQPLIPTSLYGIRIYSQGAILAPHVDRLPLVISAIINVAQDVDEPWILELIDHDGVAHNVTMEPGEMILYESHSVIHGRPYPLQGRYYANLFVHFEPYGYTQRHLQRVTATAASGPFNSQADVVARKLWKQAQQQTQQQDKRPKNTNKRSISKLPHYIQEGTLEATRWQQMYAFQRDDKVKKDDSTKTTSKKKKTSTHVDDDDDDDEAEEVNQKPVTIHIAAATGDLNRVKELLQQDKSLLEKRDDNGWQPLHEAARGGQTRVVEYLIQEGANIHPRTNNGYGATARWWAEASLPDDHPTVKLLRKLNADIIGPMEVVEDKNYKKETKAQKESKEETTTQANDKEKELHVAK